MVQDWPSVIGRAWWWCFARVVKSKAIALAASDELFPGDARKEPYDADADPRPKLADFFSIFRTAAVLPCGRETFGRGIARRAFFFAISTLRWCVPAMSNSPFLKIVKLAIALGDLAL